MKFLQKWFSKIKTYVESIDREAYKFTEAHKIDKNKDLNKVIKEQIYKVQYYIKNQKNFNKCNIRKYLN